MIKRLMVLAVFAALTACSSDSSNETPPAGNTTTGTTTTGDNGGGDNGGGNNGGGDSGGGVTPSGGLPGVWIGPNDFGEAVMIIDSSDNVYALAADGAGQNYEAVFGPASSQLEYFSHLSSSDTATATSFRLAGDRPAADAPQNKTYNLVVENDGQQIRNTAAATGFQMNLANLNDQPAISVADVVGAWSANTSYPCGGVNCYLELDMTVAADGSVGGGTDFNSGVFEAGIDGTVSAANGSSQYLTLSFSWNGTNRNGVMYVDRNDTSRIIINTVGPDGDSNASFTARLTR